MGGTSPGCLGPAPGWKGPAPAGGKPGGIPGVGGLPLGAGGGAAGAPIPGCPLGVVGLLEPGVPGLGAPSTTDASSLRLRPDGVDLEEDERLDDGLLLGGPPPGGAPPPPPPPPPLDEPAPVLSRCSPFKDIGGLGGSSSLPTSTTRSPSLFSPPSDS